MRKFKMLIAALFVMIVATGCIKYDTTISVNSDKSLNFEVIYAFDSSVAESMGGESSEGMEITQEQKDQFKSLGYDVAEYDKDGMKGIKISRKFNNIDDISAEKDVVFNLYEFMDIDENTTAAKDIVMFRRDKGSDKDKYTAKFIMESETADGMNGMTGGDTTTPGDDSIDMSGMEGMEELLKTMSIKLVVSLPEKALSNNATKVSSDGKTLTWDIVEAQQNNKPIEQIEFVFELNSKATPSKEESTTPEASTRPSDTTAKKDDKILGMDKNTFYIACGACAAVVVVAIVVIIASKGKKSSQPDMMQPMGQVNMNQFGTPAVPMAPVAPEAPVMPTEPVAPVLPDMPAVPVVDETPAVPAAPVAPVEETPAVPMAPVAPVEETPVVDAAPVAETPTENTDQQM